MDPTCADLFTIALLIGARPGEIFALQKRDWNGETKELRIQRTGEYEDGRTKTATSIRILTLSAVAAAIMDRRCFGIGPDDLIFPGTKNNLLSPSNVNKKLKRWLKEAGIQKNLHPHSLRGSSGTYLLKWSPGCWDIRTYQQRRISTLHIQKHVGRRMLPKFAMHLIS